ncbi:MAG: lipid-binding SYLF domain-containing protein [Deltaproteobacteria bacterium]|nr:lipid-binding SYLF domain-containing protein [Deltaproteobacteria bacterium]
MVPIKRLLQIAGAALLFASAAGAAENAELKKAQSAAEVLKEIQAVPEKGIPPALLANAHGVAVFPGLVKVGLTVGGEYGSGVLLVRNEQGEWSNPVFVRLIGGSVGFQIGAQSSDVILVFKTAKSIEGVMNGKFTLGADAAVAAGPVGRRAEAATDVMLKAEILSYSRSRGLFAGVSLQGAVLTINEKADDAFYGAEGVTVKDVLAGKVEAPPVADTLRRMMSEYSSERPA